MKKIGMLINYTLAQIKSCLLFLILTISLLLLLLGSCAVAGVRSQVLSTSIPPSIIDEVSLQPSTTPNTSSMLLLETDMPSLPDLNYVNISDTMWELKRLRLSRNGFEVLDERGIVTFHEGQFSLTGATDSYRRNVEEHDDYLVKTFWSTLEQLLPTEVGKTLLGFLEYYGGYYLVADAGQGIALYDLSGPPVVFEGGMSLEKFCRSAWAFFCYVENYPEVIYGGDGINVSQLPGYADSKSASPIG